MLGHTSPQASTPWSWHCSCTGPLSSPGNQPAPSPTGPLHMLSLLPQTLFHSLISFKKCLHRTKYLTGAGDMLRPCHSRSLNSCPSPCLFLPSELLLFSFRSQPSYLFLSEVFAKPLTRPIPIMFFFFFPIMFIYSLIPQISTECLLCVTHCS